MLLEGLSQFRPDLKSPLYFIRAGLYEAIEENAHYLTGVMMDFGCGSKPYKDLINVDQYIGVDYPSEGHEHEENTVDVFYDGKVLPFPDSHFDSVLSSEVFEHLFEIDDILRELNRVLKLNGKMLITCPFVWNEHEIPVDFARYTQFGLKHILSRHGFEVIKYEKKGTLVETIFQLLNIYNVHLVSNGGLFKKIPLVRGIAWKILQRLPSLNNRLGRKLNTLLPKNDELYLSNIVVVEKVR